MGERCQRCHEGAVVVRFPALLCRDCAENDLTGTAAEVEIFRADLARVTAERDGLQREADALDDSLSAAAASTNNELGESIGATIRTWVRRAMKAEAERDRLRKVVEALPRCGMCKRIATQMGTGAGFEVLRCDEHADGNCEPYEDAKLLEALRALTPAALT